MIKSWRDSKARVIYTSLFPTWKANSKVSGPARKRIREYNTDFGDSGLITDPTTSFFEICVNLSMERLPKKNLPVKGKSNLMRSSASGMCGFYEFDPSHCLYLHSNAPDRVFVSHVSIFFVFFLVFPELNITESWKWTHLRSGFGLRKVAIGHQFEDTFFHFCATDMLIFSKKVYFQVIWRKKKLPSFYSIKSFSSLFEPEVW